MPDPVNLGHIGGLTRQAGGANNSTLDERHCNTSPIWKAYSHVVKSPQINTHGRRNPQSRCQNPSTGSSRSKNRVGMSMHFVAGSRESRSADSLMQIAPSTSRTAWGKSRWCSSIHPDGSTSVSDPEHSKDETRGYASPSASPKKAVGRSVT